VGAQGAWSNQLVNLLVIAAQQAGYSGLFIYSPAPGPGNLILSIAAVPGTDPYGNAYLPILVAGLASGPQVKITTIASGGVGEALVEFPTNSAIEAGAGYILSAALGAGDAAFTTLNIAGPAVVAQGDQVIIALNSANAGATSTANGEFIYRAADGTETGTATFSAAGWTITVISMTGPNGNPVFGAAESGSYPLTKGTSGFGGGVWTASQQTALLTLQSLMNADIDLTNYLYQVLQDSGIIAGG
jgi:hypothetical protein